LEKIETKRDDDYVIYGYRSSVFVENNTVCEIQ